MKNVEITLDRENRHELNILVRRPYICLRLGRTQNALWIGSHMRPPFNWFPWPTSAYSSTLGRWSHRTVQEEIRKINTRHAYEDHPELADAGEDKPAP